MKKFSTHLNISESASDTPLLLLPTDLNETIKMIKKGPIKYNSSTIDGLQWTAFHASMRSYYDGTGKSQAYFQYFLDTLKANKSRCAYLQPDYTHIFRGRKRTYEFLKRKGFLNSPWKPFGQSWTTTTATYDTSESDAEVSSWSYDEGVAWYFAGIMRGEPLEYRLKLMAELAKSHWESTGKSRTEYKIPIVMQKPVDVNTYMSMAAADAFSAVNHFPKENESVQAGKGPFKVKVFMHIDFYKFLLEVEAWKQN